ncbi:MAG: nucleoside-diphosphate kinase [Nitrospinae bacterium CG11_big_fil_rev_8_21_14_0_20_56_8]|nr:MAG: nucleoside-diphosphate kinase [Nitrospinae bacterium CG11_big_fil_rev_8_21_14_0_20_56_8]
MEKTFGMIKPDAVERNLVGKILARIEAEGFKLVALRRIQMSKAQAEGFYAVHRQRPFFNDLTTYMSSGPALLMVLERENAILEWRNLMGATNPKDAAPGTLRKEFAIDIEKNSLHGSDAPETAAFEIPYFFSQTEIIS